MAGRSIALVIIGIAFIAAMGTALLYDPEPQVTSLPEIVEIGALLPATGDWSSHGADNNIATRLALEDFNGHLESVGAPWRMGLVVEDTQTDPVVALEKIQSLNSKGIKLVVGAETSAELHHIKPYADSNNMLLISPSSVSPKLSIKDNIFRLIPDDTNQGRVIAKLLAHQGIKVVIPVYRGDVWGDGLYGSVRDSYDGVTDEGIRYLPDITVFSTESALLSDRVIQYMEEYPKEEIAVLAIGFAEVVHLLNSADPYETLHDVRWFGSDASSNDGIITSDKIAAEFASDVEFTATQFTTAKNDRYQRVYDHLVEKTGSAPNNFVYSSYDALWILGLAVLTTQSTDASVIAGELPGIAADHDGALGGIVLNEYGDLATGDYAMYTVYDGAWKLYGNYDAADDEITLV